MPLSIGAQLGSYEITSLLGKGGMGEVYRARDTKLKREIAIKILPDEFSRNADITPDGKLIGLIDANTTKSGAPLAPQIQVVLNWLEELKQRLLVK